jgi:hypothetical protein
VWLAVFFQASRPSTVSGTDFFRGDSLTVCSGTVPGPIGSGNGCVEAVGARIGCARGRIRNSRWPGRVVKRLRRSSPGADRLRARPYAEQSLTRSGRETSASKQFGRGPAARAAVCGTVAGSVGSGNVCVEAVWARIGCARGHIRNSPWLDRLGTGPYRGQAPIGSTGLGSVSRTDPGRVDRARICIGNEPWAGRSPRGSLACRCLRPAGVAGALGSGRPGDVVIPAPSW